jgi:phosphatidylethanolamine/phosphatidyl-N-methylethanolamine N-methyltransferase
LAKPHSIGSLVPSSKHLGKSMARVVRKLEHVDRVVEIGAGTGAITSHLLPFQPTVIEIDEAFAMLLQTRFPQLDVRHCCGLQYLNALSKPIGLIISVPLINNPLRQQFIDAIRDGYQQGLIRWCVIFTYGLNSPLKSAGFDKAYRHQWVPMNFPPAHVWVYH